MSKETLLQTGAFAPNEEVSASVNAASSAAIVLLRAVLPTPGSLRHAAVAGTATAGSTNFVLQLLAIALQARAAASEFDINVFEIS
ncbi:MAG TPA: hypothetical protein VJ859_03205 [Allosphingosinicella sp.]|nr:hypothetical protein [Allosphingosinicella sp.]